MELVNSSINYFYSEKLQSDLDNLQKWEQEWLMSFQPSTCQVMQITNNIR